MPLLDKSLISVALVFIELLAIYSALHALRHARTAQAAVAWVVGLVVMPMIALPLYWIFARGKFEGYREAIREIGMQHEQAVSATLMELGTRDNARTTTQSTPLEQVADVLDTPICSGNSFRLLIDGQSFFDALIQQIESAQRYVYAEFYTVRDDEIGNRVADALIAKAKEGVTVRLLYDEVGSVRLTGRFISRICEAGVEVREFNTRQGIANRFQLNFRNHRKLLVIDGNTAIVGGLNIGDEYLGKASWVSHWRDTAILMKGPIARKVQAVFAGDYYWAARTPLPEAEWSDDRCRVLPGRNSLPTQPPAERAATMGLAAVCSTGPADVRPRATMMFAAAAGAATDRLWICTPYFVPDETSMVALSMARARGVDVRVLIPSVADHWAVFLAGYYYERECYEADIPVYRFNNGVMHQKCVLVDESLALIGSTNLDNRSLHLNFELMIAIQDKDLIADVTTMLEKDFANSRRSNGKEDPDRPILSRMGTAIARLFSPVL
jgi:cardiolipin synthase